MDWHELLLTCVEWAGIILAVLAVLWVMYRALGNNDAGWQEYLKRLVPENPVPIMAAMGFACIAFVFFLIVKGAVAYLHSNNEPVKSKPVPALSMSPPKAP